MFCLSFWQLINHVKVDTPQGMLSAITTKVSTDPVRVSLEDFIVGHFSFLLFCMQQ
jgi:hypothetical protein